MPLKTRPRTFAVSVVNVPLLWIGQSGVGQPHCLEGFVGVRSGIFVRMQLEGKFAVRFFDLSFVGFGGDLQDTVMCPSSTFLGP